MVDSKGREVPYQVLRYGGIAVRTALPANETRTWRLHTGKAPAPVKDGVTIIQTATHYEIANGLMGVRDPVPAKALSRTPAPIQGLRYPNGTWTATGPNLLSVPAKIMEVRFIERGPLKVVAEVAYRFDRPEVRHEGPIVAPAGETYYKSTVEVQAGQHVVLIEDDTTMDLSYSLNVYEGLQPTHARYRGHSSSSREAGYQPDGKAYALGHERPAMDATVDLQYGASKSYPCMARWDPWIKDSGWYWQLYNAQAPADAPLFGTFAGRAGRALGAANGGVHFFTSPEEGGSAPRAGITVSSSRRGEDGRIVPRTRFHWGIFLGAKQDLKDPLEVQPINRLMNLHGGVNLNKLHRLALSYPDPKQGFGALFMERAARDRMIAKLRADKSGPHGKGYYNYLYNADPYARDLIDMWSDPSGEKAKKAVAEVMETAGKMLNAYVNGGGIYDFNYAYWMGGLEMSRKGLWIDQALAHDGTSPQDRARAKAAAALFAGILWDEDFVPLHEGSGIHLGNPNMPVNQWGSRSFFALLLAEHPAMRARIPDVERRVLADLRAIVNEHGAEMGSVHYIGASFMPTLRTLLQLRMKGRDHFKTEERLSRFAEFYLNFLTPPEPRFGPLRKVISVGDGSTEASEIFGALATGFRDADPNLSARLMGAWRANGKPHSSFFGTTLLQIDEDAPAKDPMLKRGATFPGWYSVLRSGWGTKNESALWLVNGDFYHDHRHLDHGSVVIYALGVPLSLDWGSIYSPHAAGGYMHSMVVPEGSIGSGVGGAPPSEIHPWNRDRLPLDTANFIWGVGPWTDSTQEAFVTLRTASHARARFSTPQGRKPALTWTRSVTLMHPVEDAPIFLIRDRFGGEDPGIGKVFTMNLMAEGEVETPSGRIAPPQRLYDHRDAAKQELPSAGPVFPLPAGLQRMSFTGQWGVDWDLYTVSGEAQEAILGNWGHNWHPNNEQVQYRAAHGRDFEERQHILRIRGNGPFNAILLPYRKGEKPEGRTVTREGGKIVVRRGEDILTMDEGHYSYRSPQKTVLATFTGQAADGNGIRISGGPSEVVIVGNRATLTAHGPKGVRRVRLPGSWKPEKPLQLQNGMYTLNYQDAPPLTLTLTRID
ncbi:MAG: hypothetical protein KY468_13015 [Armatimonadetes bacterium]|nr:hypothetical protein [Armatimonadota bacterium]